MFYNYKKLIAEIPDETHAAKFLQKVGIIHNERFCCGVQMRPIEEKSMTSLFLHGIAFRVIVEKEFAPIHG